MGVMNRANTVLAAYNKAVELEKQQIANAIDSNAGEKPKKLVLVAGDQNKPDTTMRLDVEVISPEICVVEKTSEASSPSLVIHLGVTQVKIITTGSGQQKIDLNLQGFDVGKSNIKAEEVCAAYWRF